MYLDDSRALEMRFDIREELPGRKMVMEPIKAVCLELKVFDAMTAAPNPFSARPHRDSGPNVTRFEIRC